MNTTAIPTSPVWLPSWSRLAARLRDFTTLMRVLGIARRTAQVVEQSFRLDQIRSAVRKPSVNRL